MLRAFISHGERSLLRIRIDSRGRLKVTNEQILEIFQQIENAGLFTNSQTHDIVRQALISNPAGKNGARFIITLGTPTGTAECRECSRKLPADQFGYYQTRVKSDGTLMRFNALCLSCRDKSAAETRRALADQRENIPPRPEPGSICPHCNRRWPGNWHRDHDHSTGKFLGWICGNCNMAFQNGRTPEGRR